MGWTNSDVLCPLQDAESIRKNDIQKAVKAAGIEWVDTAYHRVIKAIARNVGGNWTLQNGDLD